MSSFASLSRLLAAAALALAAANAARAQATRTWVSGTGDDAGPCSRDAPCKTFAGAISRTTRDGEISVMDAGGFGAVTITKSLTINGAGPLASVLSAASNNITPSGVTVNITDAADTRKAVRLRGLNINGASTGAHGLQIVAATGVHVEDCVIDGFTGNGIEVTASGVALHVRGTTIRQVSTAIRLGSTDITASIDSCELEDNRANGLEVAQGSRATISRSVISRNAGDALFAARTSVAGVPNALINAAHNVIAHNGGAGVRAGRLSAVRLMENDILSNSVGIAFEAGATVGSDRSNRLFGNGSSQLPNLILIRR